MRQQPYTLGDVFDRIYCGLQTSCDNVYFLYNTKKIPNGLIIGGSKYLGKNIYIEEGFVKPLLKGDDVHRYVNLCSNKHVIFPYKIVNNQAILYSEEEIQKKFPYAYEYLKQCESVLRNREKGRLKDDKFWYRYIYPKNLTLFDNVKLVAPEISLGGNYTFDSLGRYYSTTTVYGYTKRDTFKESYLTYMAILNSRLCWWFLVNTGTVLANGYYRYKPTYLKPFPIPSIDSTTDNLLMELVDNLIKEVDIRKRKDIEKRIDEVVYSLYNLNEEDIEIILKY